MMRRPTAIQMQSNKQTAHSTCCSLVASAINMYSKIHFNFDLQQLERAHGYSLLTGGEVDSLSDREQLHPSKLIPDLHEDRSLI